MFVCVCVRFLLSKPFGSNKQDLGLNTLPTIIFAGAMLLNFADVSPDYKTKFLDHVEESPSKTDGS